jgi:hypothetical protein
MLWYLNRFLLLGASSNVVPLPWWLWMITALTLAHVFLHETALLLKGVRLIVQHLREAVDSNVAAIGELTVEIRKMISSLGQIARALKESWRR